MGLRRIGVYDSGYGGLSVLREILVSLPSHDVLYFGDSGRAPYGGRDVHTLLDFSEQAVEHLFEQGCSLVVVACNTLSCVTLRHLQQRYGPPHGSKRILGVTIPGAEAAVAVSHGSIGLVGTARTVASRTYEAEVAKLSPTHQVHAVASRLLAGIVEEGWETTEVARLAVRTYLSELPEIDTLLLGCTHYPFLAEAFRAELPEGVELLDPAPHLARRLVDWIERHPGVVDKGTGSLEVHCTGSVERFRSAGERFLGRPLPAIERIHLLSGRLRVGDDAAEPIGQVVRRGRR